MSFCCKYCLLVLLQGSRSIPPVFPLLLLLLLHLPGCKAGGAEEVAARFDPDVFTVLGADFTQLNIIEYNILQFYLFGM